MFISFCGHDGCGKTTQAELLKNELKETYNVISFPGYKPSVYHSKFKEICDKKCNRALEAFPEEIRSLVLLYDLWGNVKKYIEPNCDKKDVIITERYCESSYIYAPILGCNQEFVNNVVDFFPKPDLYIYLRIEPEEAMRRVRNRKSDVSSKENVEIMKKADEHFFEYFEKYNIDYITIDVRDRDVMDILGEIKEKIRRKLSYEK